MFCFFTYLSPVIGPLKFLLYINNIAHASCYLGHNCLIALYVDSELISFPLNEKRITFEST